MRKLIWINGSKTWCIDNVNRLTGSLPKQKKPVIYCGSNPGYQAYRQINIGNDFRRSSIEHILGTECSILVIDAFSGFNVELFCALCGTVASPGIIILSSPSIEDWPIHPDPQTYNLCSFPHTQQDIKGRFIRYFIHKLSSSVDNQSILSIAENQCPAGVTATFCNHLVKLFSKEPADDNSPLLMNERQRQVIVRIRTMLNDEEDCILILSGKRGRGKSTCLGVALNTYASYYSRDIEVCVVSQTRCNVQPLIDRLSRPQAETAATSLPSSRLTLTYCPPDQFLKQNRKIDLLIVDEAASVPLPQLYRMLEFYQKIILSTTTDGYEGTGLGFHFKLDQHLEKYQRKVVRIALRKPFRWPDNDSVEAFLQSSLLLNQVSFPVLIHTSDSMQPDHLDFERVDRTTLASDSQAVEDVFSILALAHYRTTPDDLRYMLDAPDLEIWVAKRNKSIYAALMINQEGGLPEKSHQDIWLGSRRLRGHLIPQYLSAQCGFCSAPGLRFKRIIRIAVHPKFQKLGIGTMLVNKVMKSEPADSHLDFFGVSFGYEQPVFNFWKALNFHPVSLGHRKNARSGARSMIMLCPVSDGAKTFLTPVRRRFADETEFTLSRPTSRGRNEFESIHSCLDHGVDPGHSYCRLQSDVYTFAFGHRQFAHCHRSLSACAMQTLNTDTRHLLTENHLKLLTLRVLQERDWKYCSQALGYTGKKQTLAELRRVYEIIYSATWGNKS